MTHERYRDAALITLWLLQMLDNLKFPPRTVLNINIPDLPPHEIQGVALTTLGQRLRGENPISTRNPRGKTLYWIGRAGGPVQRVPGTDFHAVETGLVSVTPLHADMTSMEAFAGIQEEFTRLARTFDAARVAGGSAQ